jgi:hypothetical protein
MGTVETEYQTNVHHHHATDGNNPKNIELIRGYEKGRKLYMELSY